MNVYRVTGAVKHGDAVEVIDFFVVDENAAEAARQVIRSRGITPTNVLGVMKSLAIGKNAPEPARILEGAEDAAWRTKHPSA